MKFDEKYFIKTLKELLGIDSVTGQYHELQDYLVKEAESFGFKTQTLKKGGVLIDLGGKGEGRVISAHGDTIGLMVRHINSDGTIKVCPVGGLHAHNSDSENIRIHTRSGKVITGALQRKLSSVHVTPDKAWEELPGFDENIVAIVVFSILIGVAISRAGTGAEAFLNVLESANTVILKFIDIIFIYAPIGLGCYFAALVGTFGKEIAIGFGKTFIIYTVVALLFYFIVYSLYALIAGGT